jgi:formamidopyrimidine-DNA glycosylase
MAGAVHAAVDCRCQRRALQSPEPVALEALTLGVPELPEVEYNRRRLQRAMAGKRITRVIVRQPRLRVPLASDFASRLEGQTVQAVQRRAKYLLLELSSGDRLLMHLGMSGWFGIARSRREPEPHDHVVFEMSNGAVIAFNDPRRFGFMLLLTAGEHATHQSLARLGPEPLAPSFDAAALASALARRKTSLKIALSDQRVIGGLGNIYVVEALHRARLSPKRAAAALVTKNGAPRPVVHELVKAIKDVLNEAITRRSRPGDGNPFRVYDREGEPCPRRGCRGTIRRILQGGRSTFYCPVCQR